MPILFGATTPQLSDNEEPTNLQISAGSQEQTSILSQTFQPQVLPNPIFTPAPVPPQLPGFLPPPPFAVWQQYHQQSALPPQIPPSTSTFQSSSPTKPPNFVSFSGSNLGLRSVGTSSIVETSQNYAPQSVKNSNESTFVPPIPPLPRQVPLVKPPLPPLPPPPVVLKVGKNTGTNLKDSASQVINTVIS